MHNSTFNFILKEEGRNRHAYQDQKGTWKIGAGTSLEGGLLKEEVDYILKNRIRLIRSQVIASIEGVAYLCGARQSVLYYLTYKQVDISVELADAVKANDWEKSADILLSHPADLLSTDTLERLSKQMRTGEWHVKPDTNSYSNLTESSLSAKDLLHTLQQ